MHYNIWHWYTEKQKEILIIMDKHGSNTKDQKRQEKVALELMLRVQAFKNPEVKPLQPGLTGAFSTHRVKLAKQKASPAGVDNHSLELRLCFSKSPKRYYHSGQASDNHLH